MRASAKTVAHASAGQVVADPGTRAHGGVLRGAHHLAPLRGDRRDGLLAVELTVLLGRGGRDRRRLCVPAGYAIATHDSRPSPAADPHHPRHADPTNALVLPLFLEANSVHLLPARSR